MRIVVAFLGWLRRMLDRRRARALLAKGLPRGLAAPALRPTLRAPIAAAPEEYGTLLLGAQVVRGTAPRRLFRLAALPREPLSLGALRVDAFRLDADLRLPCEREPARTWADVASPIPSRRPPRPRTPLSGAPLSRFDPRAFRLDAGALVLANEQGIPLERTEVDHRWVLASFRRQYIELPWMAQQRIWGLSPLSAEWFWMWWEASMQGAAGAVEPVEFRIEDQLWWEMERVKEQMLIRRDVVKDEKPPKEAGFFHSEMGHPIRAHERPETPKLVPPKEWVAPVEYNHVSELALPHAEAYLQWRTLIDALGER